MANNLEKRTEVLGTYAEPNRDVQLRRAVRVADESLYFRQIGPDTRAFVKTFKNTHHSLLAVLVDRDHLLDSKDESDAENVAHVFMLAQNLGVKNFLIIEHLESRLGETLARLKQIGLDKHVVLAGDVTDSLWGIQNESESKK